MKKGIAQSTFIKEKILTLLIAAVCVNVMLPDLKSTHQTCTVSQTYSMSSW